MNYPLNKNSQVKDIEAKIKEPLYQYQLIIGIYAEDTSRKDYLQHVIANSLEKVTYLNRLHLSPIEGNEDVIDGIKSRKIHVSQYKQYISESEILSLVVQQERKEIKRDVIERMNVRLLTLQVIQKQIQCTVPTLWKKWLNYYLIQKRNAMLG